MKTLICLNVNLLTDAELWQLERDGFDVLPELTLPRAIDYMAHRAAQLPRQAADVGAVTH